MFRRGLKLAASSLRANWPAALVIWLVAATGVASYYHGGIIHAWADGIMVWRGRFGLLFPMFWQALFCAVLPLATQILFIPRLRAGALKRFPLYTVFWALRGIEVEYFYRLQAWVWGSGTDPVTALCKVATDQFVYSIWASVEILFFLRWLTRHVGESPAGERILPEGWFRKLILPLTVATWVVWIPTLAVLYMLPTPLQLPFSSTIMWLWSLMLLFIAKQDA